MPGRICLAYDLSYMLICYINVLYAYISAESVAEAIYEGETEICTSKPAWVQRYMKGMSMKCRVYMYSTYILDI